MKTIEEATKDFLEYRRGICTGYPPKEWFKAGVEFAQRWIPVEEELPNEMECVLLKSEYLGSINYDVGFLMRGKFKTKNGKPTHWRPIELK